LEQAGWETLAQIEMDADCATTLRAHAARKRKAKPRVVQGRLEDIEPAELRKSLALRRGEIALIAGGPPCQPFTTHGRRQGIKDGRAAGVFPRYLQFVREFMPHAAVMENVDGILSAALSHRPLADRTKSRPLRPDEMKGSFLRWLVREMARLGYSVSWGLVEAADYGVPQFRQRALLIAVRGNQPCYLPPERPDAPRATLREALRDIADPGPVQPLSARKRSVYALIPAGGNWRDLPQKLQVETMGAAYNATGGKSGWWRRLAWDETSPTILGMPDHSSTGLIHPDEVRCLGLLECAAVQSFPRAMHFGGAARSQYQQVGNAVPPKLAKELGTHLMRHLHGQADGAPPSSPEWRQASANRRIGTHGWIGTSANGKLVTTINVKIRDDHIWAADSNIRVTSHERQREIRGPRGSRDQRESRPRAK